MTVNHLSKKLLVGKPESALLVLPEKVLQFGAGVLLRGLPDYLIDLANRQGIFNGRIAVIKSTDAGDSGVFDRQDNLYTLCVQGIENGQAVSENIIYSAISRVLSAILVKAWSLYRPNWCRVPNGAELESIVLELAHLNRLEYGFLEWLENSCTFCNSLVDRIVPGKPGPEMAAELQKEQGYTEDSSGASAN